MLPARTSCQLLVPAVNPTSSAACLSHPKVRRCQSHLPFPAMSVQATCTSCQLQLLVPAISYSCQLPVPTIISCFKFPVRAASCQSRLLATQYQLSVPTVRPIYNFPIRANLPADNPSCQFQLSVPAASPSCQAQLPVPAVMPSCQSQLSFPAATCQLQLTLPDASGQF